MALHEQTAPAPTPDPVRSAEELVRRAVVEPGRIEEIRRDPIPALQKLAQEVVRDVPQSRPIDTDVWIWRVLVTALSASMLLTLVSAAVLAIWRIEVPQTITSMGSMALGGVLGLLAPSPIKEK